MVGSAATQAIKTSSRAHWGGGGGGWGVRRKKVRKNSQPHVLFLDMH